MKNLYKISLIIFMFSIVCCKKNNPLVYRYSQKKNFLKCESIDKKLIKEALYSFENDIRLFYDWSNRNPYVAYTRLIHKALKKSIDINKITTPHTLAIFEKLENTDLWTNNGSLDFNNDFIICLINNIEDKSISKIYKSLIEANSTDIKFTNTMLIENYLKVVDDKHLSTLVALDLFYSKLHDANREAINKKVKNKFGVYQ